MTKRLYWKLFFILVLGILTLFLAINMLLAFTEEQMSFISSEHQKTLLEYGQQAESIYRSGNVTELGQWLSKIQIAENTWASVVSAKVTHVAGGELTDEFIADFNLGRGIDWKIHLYFKLNPILGYKFTDNNTHFLITLPKHMRPGTYWKLANFLLHIALPSIILLILCRTIYQHVMLPLRKLEQATRKFSDGQFDVRVRPLMSPKNDEITALAETFDLMAERTESLIITQRQLIADLSHELRTPITRVELAVNCLQEGDTSAITRIQKDTQVMRKLVEDTLTVAWLENEKPQLNQESLELVDLLDCIIDNARFEYPNIKIKTALPNLLPLQKSNNRSLGQAIENVVRNALRHTPEGNNICIALTKNSSHCELIIKDNGPGVPDQHLHNIFKPFFRIEKSRNNESNGFGLGLALAKRQIEAVGGSIIAFNLKETESELYGLGMSIKLPLYSPS
jgi:two-component system sensor histidine kinase PfeS